MDEPGPLTRKVMQYQDTVRQLVPTVKIARRLGATGLSDRNRPV